MASPTPVFPLVGSTIVPPGRSSPDRSAASIIRSAIRSFTDPPGLKYSTLASTSGARPAVTADSFTSGVPPISSTIDRAYCISIRSGWQTCLLEPPGVRGGRDHPVTALIGRSSRLTSRAEVASGEGGCGPARGRGVADPDDTGQHDQL